MIAKFLLGFFLLALPTMAEAALTCGVTSTGVAFGNWSATSSNTTGTITVSCGGASSASYTISLSTGSGTYATRLMLSGTKTLSYNMFSNSSRTTIWGNGTSGTSRVSGSLTIPGSSTRSRTHTIYARVASTPKPSAGVYSDTIVVTVIY